MQEANVEWEILKSQALLALLFWICLFPCDTEPKELQDVQQWLEVKRKKRKKKYQRRFSSGFWFCVTFFSPRCTRFFLPLTFKWGHIHLFLRFCQNWKKSSFSCNSPLHLWFAACSTWEFWAVFDGAELIKPSPQFGLQLNSEDLAKLPIAMGHPGATDKTADVTFYLTCPDTHQVLGWRHLPDRHAQTPKPGVAGRLSSREQGFSPLKRPWLVVLELLTSSGPCGGLRWLWGTVPREWVWVLNSHSSSSGRKIMQNLMNLGKSWKILQMHCCSPACAISR